MPFVSQQQRKFMYSQHPRIAARWEKETPSGKLPTYAKAAESASKKRKKTRKGIK